MEEQHRASEDVSKSILAGATVAERNASATHQLAASIHETGQTVKDLARLATELSSIGGRFKT